MALGGWGGTGRCKNVTWGRDGFWCVLILIFCIFLIKIMQWYVISNVEFRSGNAIKVKLLLKAAWYAVEVVSQDENKKKKFTSSSDIFLDYTEYSSIQGLIYIFFSYQTMIGKIFWTLVLLFMFSLGLYWCIQVSISLTFYVQIFCTNVVFSSYM